MSVFSRLAWPSRSVVGLAIVALVAAGVVGAFWTTRGDVSRGDSSALLPQGEPLVPAPEALLGDITVGTPNASWVRLQRGIGGAVGILPATAAGILCAIAGLDERIASEVDGSSAAFGAVAGDPGNPHVLFAVKLVDARRARATLIEGDTARFASRNVGEVTELVAKGRDNPPPVALGISPNGYLLVARASEDLGRLGPYVSRSRPTRPLPPDGAVILDVPRAALGSLVSSTLDEAWTATKTFLLREDERMRRNHGGRAPDYGDPKEIVASLDGWVTRRIAVAADLEKVRVVIDVTDDGLSVVTTMTPLRAGPAAAWVDTMAVGDTTPVTSLPEAAAVALLIRDNEAERAGQAREVEKLLTGALGPRLAEADAKKLHDVASDFTLASEDVRTAALFWDEPRGLVLRAPVRDADAASRGMRGAVDLARRSPFKEVFHARTLGLAYAVDGGVLTLAVGEVPTPTLDAAVRPERTLGDQLVITRALMALGKDTNSVLVVQPLRFDPMRANLPPAPLVLALGRKEKTAILRMDVANGLLRDLARRQLGL